MNFIILGAVATGSFLLFIYIYFILLFCILRRSWGLAVIISSRYTSPDLELYTTCNVFEISSLPLLRCCYLAPLGLHTLSSSMMLLPVAALLFHSLRPLRTIFTASLAEGGEAVQLDGSQHSTQDITIL